MENEIEGIDDAVEKKLLQMLEEKPANMMMWMLIQMGKTVLKTNAGEMKLKQKATLDGQRYEITAKITVKKVKL